MLAIQYRSALRLAVVAVSVAFAVPCLAQTSAIETDAERAAGYWRVVEIVEDGKSVPQSQIPSVLPGGGIVEIVDYTMIFKAPIDGSKSTKSFRLDPTSYPKRIAILDRDVTTGLGIYKFDRGRLVICVIKQQGEEPTEFSAHAGSGRTLMVLEKFDPSSKSIPGLNASVPQGRPIEAPAPKPQPYVANSIPAPPVATPRPVAQPTPQPTPQPIVETGASGRILTDAEVRSMILGTWRMNDSEGSVDLTFEPSGIVRAYRYHQTLQNFQYVFVPTPISTGTWKIENGRLIATITSSTRADRVNQSFIPAVRSISATDMILVDHLGRVSRAIKVR